MATLSRKGRKKKNPRVESGAHRRGVKAITMPDSLRLTDLNVNKGGSVLIKIVNFAKYNPRGDVKNPSWVRLERDWWIDMWSWSADAQRVWFMLIGMAKFETADVSTEINFIAANLRLEKEAANAAVHFLVSKRRIEIEDYGDDTDTLRPRDEHDTDTGVTGRDGTGRDGTGRTGNAEPDGAGSPLELVRPKKGKPATDGTQVWTAYAEAYQTAYGQAPARNAKQNAMCARLVQRLGVDDACAVVRFYVTHRRSYYVQKVHQLDPCLADCEGLRTQMLAGHRVTSADARRVDEGQTNAQSFAIVAEKLKAEGYL